MMLSLQELAERIGARVLGDGATRVAGCATIESAGPDQITFLANPKYARFLGETRAGAVIIGPHIGCPDSLTRLVADDPYLAFRNAMIHLHGFRRHPQPIAGDGQDLSSGAFVHPDARVEPGAVVHPGAVLEVGARLGARSVLYPGAYVGPQATIGQDTVLYPNVVVYDRCIVGDRVTLHANTVVGQDGFGYATHHGTHEKIPQTGIVVIEDDVELGAGCAIERAAIGETRIGKGTKFADLISIGHGTCIGENCLIVSLVGISGSVEVGNDVRLGGQVGVTGHLKIGDGVHAAGKSAIIRDVPAGTTVGGVPAVPIDKARRNAMAGRDLHLLFKRVHELEQELAQLKAERVNVPT